MSAGNLAGTSCEAASHSAGLRVVVTARCGLSPQPRAPENCVLPVLASKPRVTHTDGRLGGLIVIPLSTRDSVFFVLTAGTGQAGESPGGYSGGF